MTTGTPAAELCGQSMELLHITRSSAACNEVLQQTVYLGKSGDTGTALTGRLSRHPLEDACSLGEATSLTVNGSDNATADARSSGPHQITIHRCSPENGSIDPAASVPSEEYRARWTSEASVTREKVTE